MCQIRSDVNNKMEPTDDKRIGPPNNEQGVGSSVLNAASSESEPPGSVPPRLTSPTVTLTSTDSFASASSDYSVDGNSSDGYMLPNGHLKSTSSVNYGKDSDNLKENNEGKDDELSFRNLDLSDGDSCSNDECVDEDESSRAYDDDDDEIWDPPEAENDEDNSENSVAALADDDDECAHSDGTEWAKPSSLDYRFTEGKQKAMEEVMNGKFKDLVSELLKKLNLDNNEMDGSWVNIITPLAWQAASFLKPETNKEKAMDPAGYVKIKCVASGSRKESQLIKGLVFKKHAAHKHMTTKYKNPRLLLVQGMLGQSSGSSGLSSINALITQEKGNSSELIDKLKASRANVVLVEESASRDVLEEVLKLGVTLVLDMKFHRLERIARCTGSPILSSDVSFSKKLKHCDSLYFEKFVEEHASAGEGGKKPCKTLMFLDGCPTRLGCTILLKGSQSDELKKIKSVVQCAVVMAYHFILETSFLVDQKAMFSTMTSDQASDNSAINEQSTSDVFETSNISHMEELKVGLADEVQIPISSGGDDQSSHVQDLSAESTSASIVEVPVPSGCHIKESIHVNGSSAEAAETATSNGFHESFSINTVLVDGPSNISHKSHMGTLSDVSSSIDDALHKVAIVSPDTYQNMSTYIDLNDGKPEALTKASISVPPMNEMSDQGDSKLKDSSKDDMTFDNDSQSRATALEDDKKVTDDGEECIKPKDEISSVLDSESILVLMSSRNKRRGTICEQSHFSHIKFYRNFDVPLGRFLQDNLFNQNLQCKACNELPEAHLYYYAHHNKQLTIRVKRLGHNKYLPGESEGKLWMWSRCGKCEPDKGKATKRVLISTAARGLSFGKFLELSFSCHSSFNCLSSCGHSFQKDFIYFFGLGSMVAMFQYSCVTTYTVSVPAERLEFNCSLNKDWLQQEIESLYTKGLLLFTEVANYLKKIESRLGGSSLVLNGLSETFADILDVLKLERSEFEDNIQKIGIKNESSHYSAHKLLSLNRLRWEIMLEACVWDQRLRWLLSSAYAASASAKRTVPRQNTLEDIKAEETEGYGAQDRNDETEKTADSVPGQTEKDHNEGTVSGAEKEEEGQTELKDNCEGQAERVKEDGDISHYDAMIEGKQVTESETDVDIPIENFNEEDKPSAQELPCGGLLQDKGEEDNMSSTVTEQKVVKLISEDSFPCVSLLQESRSTNPLSNSDSHHMDVNSLSENLLEVRSIPIMGDGKGTFSFNGRDAEDSIFTDVKDDKLASTKLTFSLSNLGDPKVWIWNPFRKIREECMRDLSEGSLPKFGHLPKLELLQSPDFLSTVSQVINEEGSRLHIPISNSDYIVSDFDGEISSSVACALALMKDVMLPSDGDNGSLKRSSSEPSSLPLNSYDQDMFQSAPSMPPTESHYSSFDGAVVLDSLFSHQQQHPEINLGTEKYPVKGKCSVVILYASEFRRLRNHCCPSELDYIASLSRCTFWDAKGGKSKSGFSKTIDDRLIIKEIKQRELESFIQFAPTYFRYMKESFSAKNQICLAKILGIYQVTIRHTKSGKETKHDVMVQENVSYGGNITRQYDLKGALHARFNATTDATGDVLLDQNFVNDMNSSPLYIGQKSKRLLQRAVWNDTSFLNAVNVMDYSLLVGVDKKRRQLVCGIIDYLRQYTWDKQLETWVKSSLVVPKNVLPTIISPKEYKKRFRKFIDTHFLTVPDHWCSQRSSNPCKLCGIKGDNSKSEKREEEPGGM